MQMRVSEIVSKYNRADNKKEKAQILADLNGCDLETIKNILKQEGCDITPLMPKKRTPRKKKEDAEIISAVEKEQEEKPEEKQPQPLGKMEVPPDNILYVCDDGTGAITGGDGVVNIDDEYIPKIERYKNWRELLNMDQKKLTESEKQRLERIKMIPDEVRGLVESEIGKLTAEIINLEKRHDTLVDYLNGELPCKI